MTTGQPRRRAITFGPLEVAEAIAQLSVLGRPMVIRAVPALIASSAEAAYGEWHGEVFDLSIERHVEMLDGTFGDAERCYIPGLRSVTVRMKTFYDPGIGTPPVGEEVQFDEQLTMGGQAVRLHGRVVVRGVEVIASLDGLATAEITAEAVGLFTVEPLVSDGPARAIIGPSPQLGFPAQAVRRAIDLTGTVLGGD